MAHYNVPINLPYIKGGRGGGVGARGYYPQKIMIEGETKPVFAI